jgi:hypothetical protein
MNQAESPAPEAKKISALEARLQTPLGLAIVGLSLFIFFTAIFYFSPLSTGFDWTTIHTALNRFVQGQSPYAFYDEAYGYYYAPWATLILSPLAFLPVRLGWAIMVTLNFLLMMALARHFKLKLPHTVMLLFSPPMIYNVMQGQVDLLFLSAILLPPQLWALAALSKPQITGGLAFALLRQPSKWLVAAIITGLVIGISLLLMGNWPAEIIALSQSQFTGGDINNVLPVWPLQLIIAVTLIALGLERNDLRFFIASSPFLLRYASTGSYIGVILVLFTVLRWWQALLLVVTWWAVYIMRAL